jgi:hypothetical protein
MRSQVATFYARVSPHDLGRLPKRAQEGATHAIAVAKTRLARHDVDWVPALFHHQPGGLYAQVLHSPGRRRACLSVKGAAELSRAEMRRLRELTDR